MKTKKILAGILAAASALTVCFACLAFSGCGEVVEFTVSGSTSVQPLMGVLADAYMETHDVVITVTGGGSGQGVADARDGKVAFGMASRALKDSELQEGVVSAQIAIDGVAVVSGTNCAETNVTGEQLYGLYANGTPIGSITKAIAREASSGTREVFDEKITDADGNALNKVAKLSAVVSEQTSTGAVIGALKNQADTVSYISLGSVTSDVKKLQYNGVEATVENVKNGSYELSRPFNIVIKGTGVNDLIPEAKAFYDFIMSEEGQAIVAEEGYIRV